MNIFKFKPEDFDDHALSHTVELAERANRILYEWLEKNGVRVYGLPYQANCSTGFHEIKSKYDTHQAILINIEEIKRVPCEHEPSWDAFGIVGPLVQTYYKCSKCGVRLRAKWESVDE